LGVFKIEKVNAKEMDHKINQHRLPEERESGMERVKAVNYNKKLPIEYENISGEG